MKSKIGLSPSLVLERLTAPKNPNKDIARREYIFNMLMLGFLLLTTSALIISSLRSLNSSDENHYVPIQLLLIPVLILLILFNLSRRRFNNYLVHIFIILVTCLGTYSLHKYGYILPQGLLIYVLVIIMSGILLSARASIIITALIFLSLSILAALQIQKKTAPYVVESTSPLSIENLIIYILIFTIIFLVSWLSNREIEDSLSRARNSERELLTERNMLEMKIKSRTKELEKAQVEKSMELYRYAEFGRLSSSLLHDLANPLTAVSLNLEHLSDGRKSRAVSQVRAGVTHMEQYVQSARRQLRSQSEVSQLDTKHEIEKVRNFLASKARHQKVKLVCRLSNCATLIGDNAKFSQVVANLVANAIDSYHGKTISKPSVMITTKIDHTQKIILLSIKDKGVGIPEEEQARIFNPFFTTKSNERGTGIGLTITKKIVEEDFKGKVYVLSNNNGTTFCVELPLYEAKSSTKKETIA